MTPYYNDSRRTRKKLSIFLFAAIILSGCITKEDIDRFVEQQFYEEPTISKPVDRSFEEIQNSGVLRMITNYSAGTYFLHRGMDAGFEYEFLDAFAREHDLILEVVIIDSGDNPQELLNSGEGDVIAANYAVTPERRKNVHFTRPYNLTSRVLVFSSDLAVVPRTLEELSGSGIPVTVRRNSAGHHHLKVLQDQGYDLSYRLLPDDLDAESLLLQVAEGDIVATISDQKIYGTTGRYLEGLEEGPVIAEQDTIAWAIRKNTPELEKAMNRFLEKHFRFSDQRTRPTRSALLNILTQRYFDESPQVDGYYNPDSHDRLFSPYTDLVRSVADSTDMDWLLLTAMIAQESSFNPGSKSLAGAVGLMQVLPQFSSIEYDNLYEPETNIREGAEILKYHMNHYAYLDSLNRQSFALATYNVGMGHMVDARRLVMEQNKDPNEWDNVADALLKLMQRRYYQNARHGYIRGIETVQYVKQISNRYETYNRVLSISEQRDRTSGI